VPSQEGHCSMGLFRVAQIRSADSERTLNMRTQRYTYTLHIHTHVLIHMHIHAHVHTITITVRFSRICSVDFGGAVIEALRYKPEGRGIDSRLCHWNFSLT
jgi:hypothetical protein